jgi:hypothetical protein
VLAPGRDADVVVLDDRLEIRSCSAPAGAWRHERRARRVAEIVLERRDEGVRGGVTAVDDVSLRIEDGEFMVLSARRAAAKSTCCG